MAKKKEEKTVIIVHDNSENDFSIEVNLAFRGPISASKSDLISSLVAIKAIQLQMPALNNGSRKFGQR